MRRALLAIATLASTGCAEPLGSGEWGTFRYFADIPGQAPLRLLPPVTDRAGNVYVLYGAPDRAEAEVFVGPEGGGWSSGCRAHKGDSRGVHGWIGTIDGTAWYWSGDALVEVSGASGSCGLVLDHDPASSVEILFEGAFPWVKDTPSKVSMPALIRAPSDPRPYQVSIDLGLGRYDAAQEFSPSTATDVRVAGTGAADGEAFMLVSFMSGSGPRTEGRFLDASADTTATVFLDDVLLEKDAIRGFLEADEDGLVAGLLESSELVLFDKTDARRVSVSGMDPAGVHRSNGKLWLVGTANGGPVIARIDESGAGEPRIWDASERAASRLGGTLDVLDDSQSPSSTWMEWTDASSAVGAFPFVDAHQPGRYTSDSVGWLVAGPSFDTGIEGTTSVAFSPVGISYP